MHNLSCESEFYLYENKIPFHINGFVLIFALIQRLWATQDWPIIFECKFCSPWSLSPKSQDKTNTQTDIKRENRWTFMTRHLIPGRILSWNNHARSSLAFPWPSYGCAWDWVGVVSNCTMGLFWEDYHFFHKFRPPKQSHNAIWPPNKQR